MHIQTRTWRILSGEHRDERLLALGISPNSLQRIRVLEPKTRLVSAAQVARSIDQDPNSDLVAFIAGYSNNSALFHHFGTVKELFEQVPGMPKTILKDIAISDDDIDLAEFMPTEFRGYPVYLEEEPRTRIHVWQKVPGGLRKTTVNRRISKLLFLSGVLLYTTEGSKFSPSSSHVQLSNATPGTHRLFLVFLEALGISKAHLHARVQLHDIAERRAAQKYWTEELGLNTNQYYKPLMAPNNGNPRRRTFTLTVEYNDAMLNALLTAWGADAQKLYASLGKNQSSRGAGFKFSKL